jgi:hypothetical protein
MDNFNDLKSIWLTAKTDSLPASDEIVHIIKRYRNKALQKKVMVILVGLVSVTIMIGIVFFYKSEMPTTRIGEFFIILAGSILIFSNVRSIKRFYDLQEFSNRDYIEFLKKSRQNQIHFYKNTQVVGITFCSIGLLFYIFEFVHQNAILSIIAYSLLVIYLLILWLIVRRRVFIKHSRKLEELIKTLESLSNQL